MATNPFGPIAGPRNCVSLEIPFMFEIHLHTSWERRDCDPRNHSPYKRCYFSLEFLVVDRRTKVFTWINFMQYSVEAYDPEQPLRHQVCLPSCPRWPPRSPGLEAPCRDGHPHTVLSITHSELSEEGFSSSVSSYWRSMPLTEILRLVQMLLILRG